VGRVETYFVAEPRISTNDERVETAACRKPFAPRKVLTGFEATVIRYESYCTHTKTNSVALVRERTDRATAACRRN
jgi:hypothetical protein